MFSLSYAAQLADKIYGKTCDEYENLYTYRMNTVVQTMKKLPSFNNSIVEVKQDLMMLGYLQYCNNIVKNDTIQAFISEIPPYYSEIIEEFFGGAYSDIINRLATFPVMLKPLMTSELAYHKVHGTEQLRETAHEKLLEYAETDDAEILKLVL